jgi:glycosyltransferase involved in cell wall biosynthesis
MHLLTIIVPVHDEERSIRIILDKIQKVDLSYFQVEKEIIIINDCSKDNTADVLNEYHNGKNIRIINHQKNLGKGSALRSGIKHSKGEIIIIQDADLEYDPEDYPKLIKPILDDKADVVYGSRFATGEEHRVLYFWHYVGNKFLTLLSNMFSGLIMTDMETGYKVFRKDVLKKIEIKENRFGFEPEITAKLARLCRKEGVRIYETGISYYGRSYKEGKKIRLRDAFRAIWCIIKYNTSFFAYLFKFGILIFFIFLLLFIFLKCKI